MTQRMPKKTQIGTDNWLAVLAVGALLAGCGSLWLAKVNTAVPAPYLDEEFHVRQAQVYCKNRFHVWDPKITTPPGLYLVSWIIHRLTGRCSLSDLRALNLVTVLIGYLYAYVIIRGQVQSRSPPGKQAGLVLTAANLWLFPPLFFFSGLYYTDVQSVFWVLLAYQSFQRYCRRGFSSWSDAFSQLKFGVIALFFRQTNIFWVSVFPAGLSLISSARTLRKKTAAAMHGRKCWRAVCMDSWREVELYDLPVYEACIEDYAKTAVSLAIVTLVNAKKNISILFPYITLIVGFAGFVAWNGGVVLGDKSNHVATLHLSQMLYIWPYMLFFSWPIVAQAFLQGHVAVCSTWPQLVRKVLLFGLLTALSMVVIHYNTIVHPFILADNRHYVFYVFRILLRHPAIKYIAAPIYVLSGYAVIQTLGMRPLAQHVESEDGTSVAQVDASRTSFVLVWMIATALALITAPLVEPRYSIIPWMVWRMHLASSESEMADDKTSKPHKDSRSRQTLYSLYGHVLETIWFLVIAAGTGYMFLYKPFVWPQEPGKLQRFMW
ncbi:uncharacterized protein PV09_03712 [Verruconis gallopava]|uniref:Dol-P-Glc:Glc(2)Man(9)GlcNAc(2)-PP-Dol alpha-1,2-glucosyltransferase n=1 Tax=Verruconis gallopava TaxID=253628 RepID=A0A0D1XR36_9PEZI|nr:uncharacterized protein PV09_03712 [Verruconis gallopava]KIW05161.1 hypothetical protein PV09_03712 [Verruconis gallopava]